MECQAEKPGYKHSIWAPNVDVPFSGSTCDAECAGQRDGFGLKMSMKNGGPLCFLKVFSSQVAPPGGAEPESCHLELWDLVLGARIWHFSTVCTGCGETVPIPYVEVGKNDGAR